MLSLLVHLPSFAVQLLSVFHSSFAVLQVPWRAEDRGQREADLPGGRCGVAKVDAVADERLLQGNRPQLAAQGALLLSFACVCAVICFAVRI